MGFAKTSFKGMSVDDFVDFLFEDIDDTKGLENKVKNESKSKISDNKPNKANYKNKVDGDKGTEDIKKETKKVKYTIKKDIMLLFDKGLLNPEILKLGNINGVEIKKSTLDYYRVEWLKANEGTEKYKKYKSDVEKYKKSKVISKDEKSKSEKGNIELKNGYFKYDYTGDSLKLNIDGNLDLDDVLEILKHLNKFSRRLKSK